MSTLRPEHASNSYAVTEERDFIALQSAALCNASPISLSISTLENIKTRRPIVPVRPLHGTERELSSGSAPQPSNAVKSMDSSKVEDATQTPWATASWRASNTRRLLRLKTPPKSPKRRSQSRGRDAGHAHSVDHAMPPADEASAHKRQSTLEVAAKKTAHAVISMPAKIGSPYLTGYDPVAVARLLAPDSAATDIVSSSKSRSRSSSASQRHSNTATKTMAKQDLAEIVMTKDVPLSTQPSSRSTSLSKRNSVSSTSVKHTPQNRNLVHIPAALNTRKHRKFADTLIAESKELQGLVRQLAVVSHQTFRELPQEFKRVITQAPQTPAPPPAPKVSPRNSSQHKVYSTVSAAVKSVSPAKVRHPEPEPAESNPSTPTEERSPIANSDARAVVQSPDIHDIHVKLAASQRGCQTPSPSTSPEAQHPAKQPATEPHTKDMMIFKEVGTDVLQPSAQSSPTEAVNPSRTPVLTNDPQLRSASSAPGAPSYSHLHSLKKEFATRMALHLASLHGELTSHVESKSEPPNDTILWEEQRLAQRFHAGPNLQLAAFVEHSYNKGYAPTKLPTPVVVAVPGFESHLRRQSDRRSRDEMQRQAQQMVADGKVVRTSRSREDARRKVRSTSRSLTRGTPSNKTAAQQLLESVKGHLSQQVAKVASFSKQASPLESKGADTVSPRNDRTPLRPAVAVSESTSRLAVATLPRSFTPLHTSFNLAEHLQNTSVRPQQQSDDLSASSGVSTHVPDLRVSPHITRAFDSLFASVNKARQTLDEAKQIVSPVKSPHFTPKAALPSHSVVRMESVTAAALPTVSPALSHWSISDESSVGSDVSESRIRLAPSQLSAIAFAAETSMQSNVMLDETTETSVPLRAAPTISGNPLARRPPIPPAKAQPHQQHHHFIRPRLTESMFMDDSANSEGADDSDSNGSDDTEPGDDGMQHHNSMMAMTADERAKLLASMQNLQYTTGVTLAGAKSPP